METIENICCTKDEGTIDHSTVTKWFKEFCSVCMNLDDQARSAKPKTVDFEAIETNLESSTWRVSGDLGISQSNVVGLLLDLNKSIQSCLIVPCYQNIPKLWTRPCIRPSLKIISRKTYPKQVSNLYQNNQILNSDPKSNIKSPHPPPTKINPDL